MTAAITAILFLALVASVGWLLGVYVAVWNTRPLTMWDEKVKHWRPHSLLGTPWRSKRHGPKPGIGLERRKAYQQATALEQMHTLPQPSLEQPALEQPPTQRLDTSA